MNGLARFKSLAPRNFLQQQGDFSTRLLLGLATLVVLTTLAAGVPAYWITRGQLQRQTEQHLSDVQHATRSLYQAQADEVVNQLELLRERPTFQRLAQTPASNEMGSYLAAFRGQSGLDVLVYCPQATAAINPSAPWTHCPQEADGIAGYGWFQYRPALMTTIPGRAEATGGSDRLFAVLWLDEDFLRQMAINTGAQQSLLDGTLHRAASSLTGLPASAPAPDRDRVAQPYVVVAAGQPYLAARVVLNRAQGAPLLAEAALPIAALRRAGGRAAAILVGSTTAVAALGVLLGAWAVRRLTTPLRRLTEAAQRVGEGEFAAPIPDLSGPSEVRTLATALQRSQTAMTAALHERSQARDWLNGLIQSLVEGVVSFDTAGRITFMNQGAERITQQSHAAMLGKSINALFSMPSGVAGSVIDRIPPPGEKRQIEVMSPQGKPLVLAVTGARLVPPHSPAPTVQVALVLRDVTDEEALRNLRSYFLANISHEFRTPLSTLSASMELLLDEEEALTADEMRKLLRPSHLSLIGLQTLIDNLLESSSIEAGRFTVQRRSVHLDDVVAQAVDIVAPLLLRRGQSLTLDQPAALPTLDADPARLTQVLVNLLSNASKYSAIGQPIDLTLHASGNTVRLAVSDRGPGIPEAERSQLFERFVRLNAGSGEQYGIGLGLYVVKTIVEAHHGRLGIEPRPGGGSVFWFELPAVFVAVPGDTP